MTQTSTQPVHHRRETCRLCGRRQMQFFLELGPTPLANSFLKTSDQFAAEASYPLDVYFCENCSLVQLVDVIDPEVLFRDYIYVTGTSDTIAAHNKKYAQTVVDLLKMGQDDLVVEVASNDGSLLRCFKELNVRTLGVEPALNIADIARSHDIETVSEFFNLAVSKQVQESYGPAKAVIGNNVLAHVDDTPNFLQGFKHLLAEDGLAILEMPYLGHLLDGLEYDTIYHEHLCYFSVNSLICLCETAGLSLVRVDHVPVHGGSLRMYAGRPEFYGGHSQTVLDEAEEEQRRGFRSFATYEQFAKDVAQSRQELLDLLTNLQAQGKSIVGYGASAKGNTLLNYCQINTDLMPYTVDKSPLKVDYLTPGMHIPVRPVSTLLEEQPDYVVILAWNFADEIMGQQQEYHDRGGQFIVPIPELKVV
ncbi:MAG: class I SAM-dependent methyltransferase [Chloroflexi bacterium]|nr:class I SAM-dependent methyltransferase [Chloroflexota bacterium]